MFQSYLTKWKSNLVSYIPNVQGNFQDLFILETWNTETELIRQVIDGKERSCDLVTDILARLARRLSSRLEKVFAFYPCCDFNSDQLYPVIWEGIELLTAAGLHVSSRHPSATEPPQIAASTLSTKLWIIKKLVVVSHIGPGISVNRNQCQSCTLYVIHL